MKLELKMEGPCMNLISLNDCLVRAVHDIHEVMVVRC
jgi:hypothetical protein